MKSAGPAAKPPGTPTQSRWRSAISILTMSVRSADGSIPTEDLDQGLQTADRGRPPGTEAAADVNARRSWGGLDRSRGGNEIPRRTAASVTTLITTESDL